MPTQKEQWEEEAIERFLAFLNKRRGTAYSITGRNVRPDSSSTRDFDYQIQDAIGNKAAVEIFRLVEDGKELARDKIWGRVVTFLKEELLKRNIKGYLITTPHFSVRRETLTVFSVRLADQLETAIRSNPDQSVFESDGFEFHKEENLQTVAFTSSGDARSVDPTGTSAKSFADLLPVKNEQLATQGHERILLVLNWAFFVHSSDVICALTRIDFDRFANIHQIYYEQRPGDFHQVFDRSNVERIGGNGDIKEISPLLLETIRYKLGDKDPTAFNFVKRHTLAVGDMSWLTDTAAKENLVRVGEAYLKQNLIDETLWILRQLKDDSDPSPTGANSADDPDGKYNYHDHVLRGRDTRIITTVRGHLCWLMMGIVSQNRPELYTEIIEIVQRYISQANLYIRIQATYPLGELVRRRKAIRNQDGTSFNWSPSERRLVVDISFQMLRDNAQYPRVLEALLHVFDHLRDLTQKEASETLRTFLSCGEEYSLRNLAALIVFFAMFRRHHFSDLGPFEDHEFKKLLREQIEHGSPAMRSSLAWHFWKLMQESALPYAEIKDYLSLFWSTSYHSSVASMFGLVFEQLAQKAPSDAVALFERMILLLKEELLTQPRERSHHWVNGVEYVYPLLGKEPKRLITITNLLKDIWMLGCSVGDMPTIFMSYTYVSSAARETVRTELQAIYAEMKAHQPRLPSIDWDKR